jgi:hypothetical protein
MKTILGNASNVRTFTNLNDIALMITREFDAKPHAFNALVTKQISPTFNVIS